MRWSALLPASENPTAFQPQSQTLSAMSSTEIKMQPYNEKGRKTRFALMPLSWVIAFGTVYCLMEILSRIKGSSIKSLLQTDSLWPLTVILPGLLFGKVLGLIIINLIAFLTPSLRRIFEEEVSETGRHGFTKAMRDLSRVLALLGIVTLIGAILFLQFR